MNESALDCDQIQRRNVWNHFWRNHIFLFVVSQLVVHIESPSINFVCALLKCKSMPTPDAEITYVGKDDFWSENVLGKFFVEILTTVVQVAMTC